MNILHTISSIDKTSGGTSMYMKLMIESLDDYIGQALVFYESENNLDINSKANLIEIKRKKIDVIFLNKFRVFFNNVDVDIFHGNGLWQSPVHFMVKNALKRKIPYVLSVHGMLEPWSLKQGSFKKKVALKLFQYKDLAKATCIHATSPIEVENIRKLGFKNPIAMIPNGIQLKEFPKQLPIKSEQPKKILFLSRIHPKKGIENLIEAWRSIESKIKDEWVIEIIGNGENSYIEKLKMLIDSKGLKEQIIIKKPVFGKDKIKLFREASLFVLPTFSENFGIVIAEALASYTPVITTKGAPWEDLKNYNCGWWIEIGVAPLKQALETAMLTNDKELIEMGNNGRKLIEEKYSMESVAKQMIALYNWILTKENKPNFIDIYG